MRLTDFVRDLRDRIRPPDLHVAQHRKPVRIELDADRAIGSVGDAIAMFGQGLEAAAEREFGLRLQEHGKLPSVVTLMLT